MCQGQDEKHSPRGADSDHGTTPSEPFPWHLGAVDAHCHPTDTMASAASIPSMRARALTIMATRSQDQHLVDKVATDLGLRDRSFLAAVDAPCTVIPAFGWHPWFSHHLYDDSAPNPTYADNHKGGRDEQAMFEAKKAHYAAVLAPAPEDPDFIASLPTPTALSSLVASTRTLATSHPHALIGEIGLDKAFRLPCHPTPNERGDASSRDDSLTPGGREGRRLSPHRVSIQHQQAVLGAHLRLAGELGRPVSVHGVQVHGVLLDTISRCWKGHERKVLSKRRRYLVATGAEDFSDSDSEADAAQSDGGKPFPPRICLHSFSGSVEVMRQWQHPSIPADIFFSFSSAVNLSTDASAARLTAVVKELPADCILVESDLHTAGADMDAALEDMYRFVCNVKGWSLEEGLRNIRANFDRFIFG